MKKHLIRNAILMAVATLIMGVFLSLYIANTGTDITSPTMRPPLPLLHRPHSNRIPPNCCTALPVQQFFC